MRQLVRAAQSADSTRGFALASVLVFLVILSLLGTVVLRSVTGDIAHTGKDSRRVRAEFAAESAVQWGLLELSRRRAHRLPYTLATHGEDGTTALADAGADSDGRHAGPWLLELSELAPFPPEEISRDPDGWIAMRSRNAAGNLTGGNEEYLAFKAWYPNDSTLRISGRSIVDGSRARLELVSTLRVNSFPM